MSQYTVKHQCDKVCPDCDNYWVDKYDVEQCVAGHGDRVGRHVLACEDMLEDTENMRSASEDMEETDE